MVECVIQRYVSKSEKMMKWVLVLMTVFLGVVGVLTVIMLPAFIAALITTIYYSRRLRDEFEYGYNKYTGTFEIARILNGSKRKTCLEVNLEKVKSILPYSQCPAIREKGSRVEDYASRRVEAVVYVLTVDDGKPNLRHVIFAPTEEMLEHMHDRQPSLVTLG